MKKLRGHASPPMAIAVVAVVLALTGSAVAASGLITGADIKNGSITKADLSSGTVKSLKGKRGPEGPAGRTGFAGPQGPQGSTGADGARGPAGQDGPAGPKGTTGDTGARGGPGAPGPRGDPGEAGAPGQVLDGNWVTSGGPVDVGAALGLASTGPSSTDGVDLSDGGFFRSPGQYVVHVSVSFVDPAAADAGLEYGVGRLFLDGTPLDGVTSDPNGGSSDANTTIETPDVPDDGNNVAQATGTFIVNVGDDGGGGEQITLRGAVRTAEPDGASATGQIIITRVG